MIACAMYGCLALLGGGLVLAAIVVALSVRLAGKIDRLEQQAGTGARVTGHRFKPCSSG